MFEKLTIYESTTPCEVQCEALGDNYNYSLAVKEANITRDMLYRFINDSGKTMPENFSIVITRNSHDYGTYLTLDSRFDSDNEEAWDLAMFLESESPTEYDSIAQKEYDALR